MLTVLDAQLEPYVATRQHVKLPKPYCVILPSVTNLMKGYRRTDSSSK